MKNQAGLWVILADMHYPYIHEPTFKSTLHFIQQNKNIIKGFIFLGDEFDNDCISHWNKNKPLLQKQGAYKQETLDFDKHVLTPLEKALPKSAIKVVITGNHTRFETDFIEENPQFDGFERFKELKLQERGWNVIPLGLSYKLGKLVCIHGDQLANGFMGQYPAKKAVETYAKNVLQAHTHSPQSFTKTSPVDSEDKWMGYVSPIVGTINPRFIKNRPNSFAHGLTLVEVRPNGHFNCYLVITEKDGTFSYGGKTYKAK